MDSYNLQATEDQLNSLGQSAVDESNFVAQYNANQVASYRQRLGQLETKWGTEDSENLKEFGAYQLHLGDASKRLYDAVKGGFSVEDSQLVKKPMALYEGTKYVAKLPGRLITKAPINDVFTGKQAVNNVDISEVSTQPIQTEQPIEPQSTQTETPSESEPATSEPNPSETDAGTTTETGASTGTEVAGAVDETAEASEGLANTSRMAKLGASLKSGLSTAGTVAEGVGKVAGTVASGVFLASDIDQQVSQGKFFYGDDTTQKVGNFGNEIGSAMDIVGVATGDPLLVALGVGASAIGGLISGLDELFEHKKQEKSPQEIKQEQLQKAQTIKEQNVGVDTTLAGGGALAQETTSTLRQ